MEVNGQNLNITMSGSSQYNIDVNGNTQITSSNNFETVLSSGLNIIKVYIVKMPRVCRGTDFNL